MYHCVSTCFLSAVITITEQVDPLAVAQNITVKFLTNENVKPAEILKKHSAQFSDKMLSRTQVCDWSRSFTEGKTELKT
jgi:hypothetical protein